MYIWPFGGDAISWPTMYAETGLAANFRFGSLADILA
jgi:hypothetical protein